jgi:hypothetical protein
MSAKHTPGPWFIEKQLGTDDLDCGWEVAHLRHEDDFNYRGPVARITDAAHIDGITVAERDANARLIVKSPVMRSLLVEAADLLGAITLFSAADLTKRIDALIAEIDG